MTSCRYEKYVVSKDDKKDNVKSADPFMDEYTALIERINELNLVSFPSPALPLCEGVEQIELVASKVFAPVESGRDCKREKPGAEGYSEC